MSNVNEFLTSGGDRDLGNSDSDDMAVEHFSFLAQNKKPYIPAYT
jgi:hypothetical protein